MIAQQDERLIEHFKAVRPKTGGYWRVASCDEANCPDFLLGWRTVVPKASDHADFIRHRLRGYQWREEDGGPGLAAFVFGPGQQCFVSHEKPHIVAVERLPLLLRQRDVNRRTVGLVEFTDEYNERAYLANQARKAG